MTRNDLVPLPVKLKLRKNILAAVCFEHRVSLDELLGRGRTADLTDARKDAAHRLHKAGFSKKRIAQILRRDHSTVFYYFDQKLIDAKRDWTRNYRMLGMLPPEVAAIVQREAIGRGVMPYEVIVDWVIDRAGALAMQVAA